MIGTFEGRVKDIPIRKIFNKDIKCALIEEDNVVGFELYKYLAMHKDERIRITVEKLWEKPKEIPSLEDLPDREFFYVMADAYQDLLKQATEMRTTLENLTNKTFGLLSDFVAKDHKRISQESNNRLGRRITETKYQ